MNWHWMAGNGSVQCIMPTTMIPKPCPNVRGTPSKVTYFVTTGKNIDTMGMDAFSAPGVMVRRGHGSSTTPLHRLPFTALARSNRTTIRSFRSASFPVRQTMPSESHLSLLGSRSFRQWNSWDKLNEWADALRVALLDLLPNASFDRSSLAIFAVGVF
jgi:hypothetical protein